MEYVDEVTDYEPGRRIAHRTVEGPIQLSTACLTEPAGEGCRARVIGEADNFIGGWVSWPTRSLRGSSATASGPISPSSRTSLRRRPRQTGSEGSMESCRIGLGRSGRGSARVPEQGGMRHSYRDRHRGARGRPGRDLPDPPDYGHRCPRILAFPAYPVRARGPFHSRSRRSRTDH